MPISTIGHKYITKMILWTGMLISLCYQIYRFQKYVEESIELFQAHEQIDEAKYAKLPLAVIFFLIRVIIFLTFWFRISYIANIVSLTEIYFGNNDIKLKELSSFTRTVFIAIFIAITLTISLYSALFYSVQHGISIHYFISLNYSIILLMSILSIYYIAVHFYQESLESFLNDIPYGEIDIVKLKSELHSIKGIHEIVESKLGIFILLIFVFNYMEIFHSVIVIPHSIQYDFVRDDLLLWILQVLQSTIIVISIMIVVIKVDSQKWTTDLLFRTFERSMIERRSDTEIILFIMDVKDTIDAKFTAWLGFIQINRSVLISYLINLIVYGEFIVELIHWFAINDN